MNPFKPEFRALIGHPSSAPQHLTDFKGMVKEATAIGKLQASRRVLDLLPAHPDP